MSTPAQSRPSAPATTTRPGLGTPRGLFRLAAGAEMVTWALLLGAMALKYTGVTDAAVRVTGGIHGFVFLSYVLVMLAVWIDGRWSAGRGLLGLGSSVVPFMTVPFERSALRRGDLPDAWRVLSAGEEGGRAAGPLDRPLVAVLRHPALSVLGGLVVVALAFTALLAAGPPTEWGR